MARGELSVVLGHLRRLAGVHTAGDLTDRQLLERFVGQRDEAAFATLVQRHGPLVWSVCRRALPCVQDAEDTFQATFLVLVQKAGAIRWRDSVGGWLYEVAYRLAAELKVKEARRRVHERRAPLPQAQPAPDAAGREVCAVLDEELHRLPERYRVPLLLCYLEGRTGDQAARELGWSLRTLQRRLEQGRELLRLRLARRGVTLSAGLLAAVIAGNAARAAISPAVAEGTIKAAARAAAGKLAAGSVSGRVAGLVEGVVRAMFWAKMRTAIALSVAAGVAACGAAVLAGGGVWGGDPNPAPGDSPAALAATGAPPGQQAAVGGGQPEDAARLARERAQSRVNLKKLALAMHNYHDTYGTFPPPAIYSGQAAGRPSGMAAMMGKMGAGMPGGGMAGMPGMPVGGMAGMRGGMGMRGMPGGSGAAGPGGMPGAAGRPPGPGEGTGEGRANRMQSMMQRMQGAMGAGGGGMKGGSAMMAAEPAPAPRRFPGKALLSWRVSLLPYLGENALWLQFKLDEPWDSPHNKKLLERMPAVYAPPRSSVRYPPGFTFYQVFVGPGAGFEKHRALSIADITDGTSNTLMIVEAGSPVPWTKPEDLPFDPDEPLPELGGLFPDGFDATLFDGSVHTIRRNADEQLLRRAVTRSDGEVIDLDQLFEPEAGGGAGGMPFGQTDRTAVRKENQQLKQELKQVRTALERLQNELALAQEMDQETARLKEENARLRQEIEAAKQQAKTLAEQLQRFKGTAGERPK